MRNKCYLPSSMEELKGLSQEKLAFYWKIFYLTPPRAKRSMLRPLWYALQCERFNLKLEEKFITRLNRYASNPERYIQKANKNKYSLAHGTEIIKVYKDKEYKIIVKDDNAFMFNDKIYKTLSAIACEISGKHLSGPDFFGLV
ncbi:MAG: DUF2924 domain-containing protein [Elusimicrobiota bacterium]|nr:DUF2924 domain-containing protein [Elusimicrobiota bacterium]